MIFKRKYELLYLGLTQNVLPNSRAATKRIKPTYPPSNPTDPHDPPHHLHHRSGAAPSPPGRKLHHPQPLPLPPPETRLHTQSAPPPSLVADCAASTVSCPGSGRLHRPLPLIAATVARPSRIGPPPPCLAADRAAKSVPCPRSARCRWRQAPTTSNPCYGPPPPSSVLLPRHRNQGTNPPVPIMALETLIRASSPPLHPNMSNHHRCPWKKSIYRRRKIDWRSERSARVVETGVELRTREEVHHGGAVRRLSPRTGPARGPFLYSNVSMHFCVYGYFTPRCFFTFCDFSRICNA
ncbi:extensin-like [Triticum urartu]|uniref:extensin-like n=1 Tax=Triticum urartu TaxID=4572 RepID=UPI002042FB44|nr:extensin-like [Triticum urartu]